jgi:hypothetical protein
MKIRIIDPWTCLMIVILSGTVMAQEADNTNAYHPFLTDKFKLGLGGFWPKKSSTLQADGSAPGEQINFDESLAVEESESTTSFNFRWRYSKNWSLWAQYWTVDSEGSAYLTKDVKWEDVIFKEGTFTNGGVDMSITRIFLGRSFWTRPGHEFGAGAGIHWIKIDAFIEGEIVVDPPPPNPEFRRESVSASAPLPNVGAWYMYSWSPKWLTYARLDWMNASVGKYSGALWHAEGGINYQISRTFGIGLAYSNFTLDLDVDDGDWHGQVETQQYGPRLELTASW